MFLLAKIFSDYHKYSFQKLIGALNIFSS